jgi:hypothetical protein
MPSPLTSVRFAGWVDTGEPDEGNHLPEPFREDDTLDDGLERRRRLNLPEPKVGSAHCPCRVG